MNVHIELEVEIDPVAWARFMEGWPSYREAGETPAGTLLREAKSTLGWLGFVRHVEGSTPTTAVVEVPA